MNGTPELSSLRHFKALFPLMMATFFFFFKQVKLTRLLPKTPHPSSTSPLLPQFRGNVTEKGRRLGGSGTRPPRRHSPGSGGARRLSDPSAVHVKCKLRELVRYNKLEEEEEEEDSIRRI